MGIAERVGVYAAAAVGDRRAALAAFMVLRSPETTDWRVIGRVMDAETWLRAALFGPTVAADDPVRGVLRVHGALAQAFAGRAPGGGGLLD